MRRYESGGLVFDIGEGTSVSVSGGSKAKKAKASPAPKLTNQAQAILHLALRAGKDKRVFPGQEKAWRWRVEKNRAGAVRQALTRIKKTLNALVGEEREWVEFASENDGPAFYWKVAIVEQPVSAGAPAFVSKRKAKALREQFLDAAPLCESPEARTSLIELTKRYEGALPEAARVDQTYLVCMETDGERFVRLVKSFRLLPELEKITKTSDWGAAANQACGKLYHLLSLQPAHKGGQEGCLARALESFRRLREDSRCPLPVLGHGVESESPDLDGSWNVYMSPEPMEWVPAARRMTPASETISCYVAGDHAGALAVARRCKEVVGVPQAYTPYLVNLEVVAAMSLVVAARREDETTRARNTPWLRSVLEHVDAVSPRLPSVKFHEWKANIHSSIAALLPRGSSEWESALWSARNHMGVAIHGNPWTSHIFQIDPSYLAAGFARMERNGPYWPTAHKALGLPAMSAEEAERLARVEPCD